jgi:hypothetical protein
MFHSMIRLLAAGVLLGAGGAAAADNAAAPARPQVNCLDGCVQTLPWGATVVYGTHVAEAAHVEPDFSPPPLYVVNQGPVHESAFDDGFAVLVYPYVHPFDYYGYRPFGRHGYRPFGPHGYRPLGDWRHRRWMRGDRHFHGDRRPSVVPHAFDPALRGRHLRSGAPSLARTGQKLRRHFARPGPSLGRRTGGGLR